MKISINKELIHTFPVVKYSGKVFIVDNESQVDFAIDALLKERVVGIDTETRPSFRKHEHHEVALLQVSTLTTCYLFRLNKLKVSDKIISFLENKDIVKVGLSLRDDVNALHKRYNFEPQQFVDLQNLVKDYYIEDMSLQKIYAIIFGKYISKGQRLTNWEASELTIDQQNYAALDAWACLQIYNHLESGKFIPEESPYIVNEEELEDE